MRDVLGDFLENVRDFIEDWWPGLVLAATFFLTFTLWILSAPHIATDSAEMARCKSLDGVYGGGKCFVNGEEK